MLDFRVFCIIFTVQCPCAPNKIFKVEFRAFRYNMSTSTRITRSKGESDGLGLPMRMRPTRRDTTLGRNGGTALSTSGREHQQQMPTQTPHLTQSPEAASAKRTAAAPMLPLGPHRPLTPCMPLPTLPMFIRTPVPGGRVQLDLGGRVRSDIYPQQKQRYVFGPSCRKTNFNTF